MGSRMALLSMGRRGAVLFDGETLYRQASGKEKAADSMGAGDSFLTSFATSYLSLTREHAGAGRRHSEKPGIRGGLCYGNLHDRRRVRYGATYADEL